MSLDPEVRQLLEPLWDYWAVSEPPRATDVIFVFGSRDLALPARAAEFYHEGHARHVLVTGSYGRMTRDVFPKSEALVFKGHLVSAGVPPSAVLTESDASNTLENVRLGMEMMRRASRLPESALLVAKGFVMRRCVATFSQQFARTEVRACPPRTGLTEALDRSASAFALRLVAEIDRLDRYAEVGHIQRQDVPVSIREAAAGQAADRALRAETTIQPRAAAASPHMAEVRPATPWPVVPICTTAARLTPPPIDASASVDEKRRRYNAAMTGTNKLTLSSV